MSRVELDEDDTAELANVVLDRGELIRRRDKKLKSLYKRIQNEAFDFYRCLVCKPDVSGWVGRRETRDISFTCRTTSLRSTWTSWKRWTPR